MDSEDVEDMSGEQASLNVSGERDNSIIGSPMFSAPASPEDDDLLNSIAMSNPQSPEDNSPTSPDGPSSPVSPHSLASPGGPASPDDVADVGGADSLHSIESPANHDEIASPTSPGSPSGSVLDCPLSPTSSNAGKNASPAKSPRSRSVSPNDRSRSNSPAASKSRSRSRSGSPAALRSRSASPAGSRGRSWSASPPGSRSNSVSQAGSRNGSPGGSRSRSVSRARSGSGSRKGSPSGSLVRSKSGSQNASRSVSPAGSRSRSRSASPAKSRSISPALSHSRSRSVSAARSRSRSGSAARSRSVSAARSRSKSGSPARSRSRSGSAHKSSERDNEKKSSHRKHQDGSDNEGSDKGSEVGELIADIFGSSDEEEFEGFGNAEAEAPKKEKKKPVISDDEGGDAASILPDLSDDDDDGKNRPGDFVSDFDLMLEKKKEEMRNQRRKRKDIDIINDNDDLIDALIGRMKIAAEEDRTLNQQRKPAVRKLSLLPKVVSQLKKADLQNAFIDGGILNAMTEWLAPLPDKSLPHLQIREAFLKHLLDFPTISNEGLKTSGIGKAVMYLYKHPKEIRTNKDMAQKLINEWSRPIFNLTSDLKLLSREEREQRDYEHLPKKRRISLENGATPRRDIDRAMADDDKVLRPGDPGYVYRARVPHPSVRDYVIRPKWNIEEKSKGPSKKQVSKYEQHVRAQKRKMSSTKQQRAVTMSIEGRNMAL